MGQAARHGLQDYWWYDSEEPYPPNDGQKGFSSLEEFVAHIYIDSTVNDDLLYIHTSADLT